MTKKKEGVYAGGCCENHGSSNHIRFWDSGDPYPLVSRKKLIDYKVLSREVTLTNPLGLHARPAAMIAKIARTAEKNIWLGDGDYKADAASVIDILSISGTKGKIFVLEAESENDLPLLEAIVAVFKNGFGEVTNGQS